MLLVHNSFLAKLVLINLSLQALSGRLEHSLLPIMILLEYLLNLGRDCLGISVLIRVILKNLKDATCQLLIIDESFLEIAEPRFLAGTDHI